MIFFPLLIWRFGEGGSRCDGAAEMEEEDERERRDWGGVYGVSAPGELSPDKK